MTGKERVAKAWNGEKVDRSPFWLGEPTEEALEIYLKHFDVTNRLELAKVLKEDLQWMSCDFAWEDHTEKHTSVFVDGKYDGSNQAPVFRDCEDVKEVENYHWADPTTLNLNAIEQRLQELEKMGVAVFSGMWSCFFHNVADYFGMEIYFEKMYTNPEVVHAVTKKVVDYYLISNRIIFERFAHRFDAFFMGNDFGTQLCTLISPDCFKEFILPYYKQLIDLAHEYHLKVMVHSCGAITRIIPDLIEAGIDGLHPLQALAADMNPENLLEKFGNKLLYMGGVDTQDLLPFGTPEQVKQEVVKIKNIFGQKFVISPSHEALLPNVSTENVMALSDIALRY